MTAYAAPPMAEPVLWPLDDHTRAKHRVLRAYLDAWIPVMAQQALKVRAIMLEKPRLLLVDGFAGPGPVTGFQVASVHSIVLRSAIARLPPRHRIS